MKATSAGRRPPGRWAARALGSVGGAALAASLLASGVMPVASGESPAVAVTVTSTRSGTVLVTPGGKVLEARLRPGAETASTSLVLVNRAGRSLDVHVRAEPSNADLDQLLAVRVRHDGAETFNGRLSELRRLGSEPVRLGVGVRHELEIELWLPPHVQTGYEYRELDLVLHYVTRTR